jgi:nicotinamide-nucleotide amidase
MYDADVLAEILTIGDELCRGEIVDTNAAWLAAELWALDIPVAWITSCRDEPDDLRRALETAASRADLVLTSGGLGPTEDDLTVDVVAGLLGVAAVIDEPSRQRMEAALAARNYRLTPNNLRQVRVPEGAAAYANPAGLAPGFGVRIAGRPVFCLPGVPRELEAIFASALREQIAALRERSGAVRIARRTFRVFGKGESHVAAALEGLVDGVPGASLHYQVAFPETLVKLVVRDRDPVRAASRLEGLETTLRQRLGDLVYGTGDDSLAAALGRALQAAGLSLATAESCTGGLLGALITAVPGASSYYRGGAVTYADEEKVRQLGVRVETLERDGAVSAGCVREMAQGARDRFAVDLAVAVSGVAGPGGGSPDKPVGTVWIAVAGPGAGDAVHDRLLSWPGTREQVRRLAAYWAMSMVRAAALAAAAAPAQGAPARSGAAAPVEVT